MRFVRALVRKERDLLLGAAVGLAMALVAFTPSFLAGTGPRWTHPANDYIAYLVSWYYFVADAWRFPVFDVPAMGYPEGGNVTFNDGLPLLALVSKAIVSFGGPALNPFGAWILLTWVLQGAMAVRLLRACGGRGAWPAVAVACLAVAAAPFRNRTIHIALSSHFLLLWALALYVECHADGKLRRVETVALSALTLLVNAYLFVMVLAIQAAAVASFAWKRRGLSSELPFLCGWALLIALLLWMMGYGAFLAGGAAARANGFGRFSWNIPTLVVPPSVFGYAVPMVRDRTGGQYEGESFIGLGALLLLVLSAVAAPRGVWRAAREHWCLVLVILVLCVLAATNAVWVGRHLVLHVRLSKRVLDWVGTFRASGRFVWVLAYLLIVVPAAVLLQRWPRRTVAAVLAAAVVLQLSEWAPEARNKRRWSDSGHADMFDTARLERWLSQHERVFVVRSFMCGYMQTPAPIFGSPESNRELQIQLLAARLNKPINGVYTSRQVKDCPREQAWETAPRLEPGTLYLIGPHWIDASPPLQRALATASCRDLSWARACSTQALP